MSLDNESDESDLLIKEWTSAFVSLMSMPSLQVLHYACPLVGATFDVFHEVLEAILQSVDDVDACVMMISVTDYDLEPFRQGSKEW